MSGVDVMGLFPTPFMRVRALLGPSHVAKLLAAAESAPRDGNSKSKLLSHTHLATPASAELYREPSELIAPRLGEFGALLFGERLAWTIKEIWINVLEPGGEQAIHSHANSFISGVVYLTESHASARTVFYRSLGGRDFTFSNDHRGSTPGPFNSPKWAVPEVAPGDLVLFPSYLLHAVPENQGERRITMAFNAVPEVLKSWGYEIRFT